MEKILPISLKLNFTPNTSGGHWLTLVIYETIIQIIRQILVCSNYSSSALYKNGIADKIVSISDLSAVKFCMDEFGNTAYRCFQRLRHFADWSNNSSEFHVLRQVERGFVSTFVDIRPDEEDPEVGK